MTRFPITGALRRLWAWFKPRFNPAGRCENQVAPDLWAVPGPTPTQSSSTLGAAPASGSAAADLVGDAQQTLQGLGDAARAKQNGHKSKARGIQQQAMEDLNRFYSTYGPGGGG